MNPLMSLKKEQAGRSMAFAETQNEPVNYTGNATFFNKKDRVGQVNTVQAGFTSNAEAARNVPEQLNNKNLASVAGNSFAMFAGSRRVANMEAVAHLVHENNVPAIRVA